MARFTKKDLVEAMGLKPGDKINIKTWRTSFTVNDEYNLISDVGYPPSSPTILIGEEFEIVQPKKKVGDLICEKVGVTLGCTKCPLRAGYCKGSPHDSLYNRLDKTFAEIEDKEIYNILKARLDKEVE